MAAQLKVRLTEPPSSAGKTLRVVVVPFTGEGEAAAAVVTVGAWLLTINTWTELVMLLPEDGSVIRTSKV